MKMTRRNTGGVARVTRRNQTARNEQETNTRPRKRKRAMTVHIFMLDLCKINHNKANALKLILTKRTMEPIYRQWKTY